LALSVDPFFVKAGAAIIISIFDHEHPSKSLENPGSTKGLRKPLDQRHRIPGVESIGKKWNLREGSF
jgi:hypothetical protein